MYTNKDLSLFPRPSITVDIIIFVVQDKNLQVLLVKRKLDPFKNEWALPGGFVRISESVDDAALRELSEETGLKNVYLEQLYTFGDKDRDPRGRVITVSYYALIPKKDQVLKASADASVANWFNVENIKSLAFDHKKILDYSVRRLRNKVLYSSVAYSLLPKNFTLSELQEIYHSILGKSIDKRNFRKQMLRLNLISEVKGKTKKGGHRPAQLYFFKKREIVFFK